MSWKWIAAALVGVALALAAVLVRMPAAQSQDRPRTYACVISIMGKMAFYRGGFVSWTNCMAFCSYNANIRALGGMQEVRYNCPPENYR